MVPKEYGFNPSIRESMNGLHAGQCDTCMSFIFRPRGSNGTVAVRLITIVWPVHSTHRAAVLVPLAGASPLSGSP